MQSRLITYLLFLILSLSFPVSVKGSSNSGTWTGFISGKVLDSSSNEPMEFATVSVYSPDSELVMGNITSLDGSFSLTLPEGQYDVMVQFISYEDTLIENIILAPDNQYIDIGSIRLLPDTELINEVTVTAEKSEMIIGLDKKIFNVGKDLGNSGNSAAEILDNIPSVTVDLDGTVSLRGSTGVQLLIDGKPSGLVSNNNPAALRSLQGSIIERVEVVTNPSARYEAEGMSGIINIVLKKDQQRGVNGSFELTAGYPHEYRAGANVNFRREKLNYFLNYGLSYNERPGEGSAVQNFMFPDTSYRSEIENSRLRTGLSNNLRGGADYFINDRNVLTAAVFLGYSDQDNFTNIWYRDYDQNDELQMITFREDIEKEIEHNIEFSLNYDLSFDKEDRKFNAFMQYIEEAETETSDIGEIIEEITGEAVDDDPLLQKVRNEESQKNFLIQADYTHPFGAGDGMFEAGYRSGFRLISNPYKVQEKDENGDWFYLNEFTNDFSYQENIHAIYAQAGNKFGKWSVQLGLRSELSDVRTFLAQNNERNDRVYFDVFPTAHTAFEFNDINSAQLSYSRRINRPHFYHLNPFHSFTDARNIRTGNPNLEPEYTDSYELGYLRRNGKTSLYSGAYFRHTMGVNERISEVDENGITYVFPINLSTRNSYGLESNLSIDASKWWTLSGDINLFRAITDGSYEGEQLHSDTYSWNGRLNSMMKFRKDFDIQATFFYRGAQQTTQGSRLPYYRVNLAASKDILKGNGTLTLNIRDVLNSSKYGYIIDHPNLYSENEFRWSGRTISLTFIYRLNQQKKMVRENNRGGFGGGDEQGM